MRSRSSLLLVLGLVLAAGTAVGLYFVASGGRTAQPSPSVAAAAETVTIIAAKADIPARTVVTADMVTKMQLPTGLLPPTAARVEGEVIGKTTLAPIPQGAALLLPQLTAAQGKTGFSIAIDPGKVLVAFPTTDLLTSAGLVSAGDHIDLLATVVSGTGDTARRTQTTIQNLEVVDVLGPNAQTPSAQRALTFVVDHQIALFLKYLRDSQASVDVVIRSRSETDAVRTQTVTVQVLQDTFGFR